MSVCILKDENEIHKASNARCSVKKQYEETPFGNVEIGRSKTCSMTTETKPKMMKIYELKCKEESCNCKRFQVLKINSLTKGFEVSGECLSDEEL